MIFSSKGEGAFCSQKSHLPASQVMAVNQILDALRASGVNGYRVHGWHIDRHSIEPLGVDTKFGIQFRAHGLPGKPTLQILLNEDTQLADIFAGKLQRKRFAGCKIGARVPLAEIAAVINLQFAIRGSRYE